MKNLCSSPLMVMLPLKMQNFCFLNVHERLSHYCVGSPDFYCGHMALQLPRTESLSWISPWKECLQSSSRRLGKLKLLVFCQLPWAAHLLPARGNPTVRDLKLHGENIWHRSFQQLQKCRIISQRPLLLLSSDETFGAWQEYCVIKVSLL